MDKKLTPLEVLDILKKRKEQDANNREENRIVLIERKQRSTNNPAIAQLYIRFSSTLDVPDLKPYYLERKEKYSISAPVHKITQMGSHTYVIEIRGVLPMYDWMEFFIKSFLRDFGKRGDGLNIEVIGDWEKYNAKIHGIFYAIPCEGAASALEVI